MSRHEFEALGVSVAIGWDAPMATFYLQVWSDALQTPDMDEDERASPQIWLGDDYGQHPELDAVLAVAHRHMPTLPEGLAEDLRRDRHATPPHAIPADVEETVRLMNELIEGAARDRSIH